MRDSPYLYFRSALKEFVPEADSNRDSAFSPYLIAGFKHLLFSDDRKLNPSLGRQ